MADIVVAVDVEYEVSLVSALAELPDHTVVRRPADAIELLASVESGVGEIVIIGPYFTGADADVVERLHAAGARVLGFSDNAAVLERLHLQAGVSPLATAAELSVALRALGDTAPVPPRPSITPAQPSTTGRIITVWGTAGAPGRSTIAAQMADLLARRNFSVVLIDADTVAASQATIFGLLDDAPVLAALCRMYTSGDLDYRSAQDKLHHINPQLSIATGLSRAARWQEIRASALTGVVNMLARHHDAVIIDVSDRIDPDDEFADPLYDRHVATRAAIEAADEVVVVAAGDPLGLQRLVKTMDSPRCAQLAGHLHVVINKLRASAVGKHPEQRIVDLLQRFTGLRPTAFLPDVRSELDHALLAGKTLSELGVAGPFLAQLTSFTAELGLGATRDRSNRKTARLRSLFSHKTMKA